ncbi:esterase/lipase family protein [Allomesorhizobium alhagi]|uniref:AB hydrolase-1 domain-containing protein n=1 Tax=Mesorhizobium alhagi CCNWXJ12-2 TaxID=1107882 RepID=H0HXR4_9HYPH|nr:hypothetical protein [Mesorhizobium alhagi]EHK54478.1 hypothetical protein MAXJ12_24817 [Mesorhizobium alhagi CCNWXJ12-2]
MLNICRLSFSLLALLTYIQTSFAVEPKLLSAPATAQNADRALIFVHGLLGAAEGSFANWPEIIADDDTELPGHGKLSDFAVYSVDYQADFLSQAKLDEVAVGVSRDLAASQIFRRHRHVWLVAHSMGGLILKRSLTLWVQERKELLIDRIMAVGLLGVPSNGAPLADLVKKHGIDRIALTFGWNGALLEDLTTNSGSYLTSLETNWEGLKRNRDTGEPRRFTPVISCGYEEKPQLAGSDWWGGRVWDALVGSVIDSTVVPDLFAKTACHDRRHFSVRHTDLIKPTDQNDTVHVWLRNLIITSITKGASENRVELSTRPPSARSSEATGRVDFNLYDRVATLNQGHDVRNLDQQTGLSTHPERIVFANSPSEEQANSLVLRGGPFLGSTLLDAWYAAAAKNTCLKVEASVDRLKIILAVDGKTVQCSGGAMVCKGQSCT